MHKQFMKFALVGAVATLTTYAVLILLVEVFHQGAVLSSLAGYLLGAWANYLLNYHFTFDSDQRHVVVLPKFLTVMAVGFLFNAIVMYAAIHLLSLQYLLAQLIAVSVVLVWSFTINRLWAFAK